MYLIRI